MTLQKHYNHYRDRGSDLDLDLDLGVVIYNQIVTWTAFAILAMFLSFSLFQNLYSCKEMIVNGEQDEISNR